MKSDTIPSPLRSQNLDPPQLPQPSPSSQPLQCPTHRSTPSREAIEEQERRRYYASMRPSVVQRSSTHYIYKLTSHEQHPKYPRTLYMKVFSQCGNECEREKQVLLLLKDRQDLNVPRYEDSFVSGGKMNLFMTGFDGVLTVEIDRRARAGKPWTELELWKHLYTLAYTVKELHNLRIVHRNITPDCIFLKDGRVYLGHFDDSKEINRGVTQHCATLRGSTNYLTPQCFEALSNNSSHTYEVSMKDDMWGLGRTLFDMSTLHCNNEMISLYRERSQSVINQYVKKQLAGRYSLMFEAILLSLLKLDWGSRQQSDEFFDGILSSVFFVRCSLCGEGMDRVWDCPHAYCDRCLYPRLLQRAKAGENLRHCECAQPLILECVNQLPPKSRNLVLAVMQNSQKCVNKDCTVQHVKLSRDSGEWKPYAVRCACGAVFCSYCQVANGHKSIFMMNKQCPEFVQ